MPSCTFIATASSVVARGATPIIADVDYLSQNITPETIAPLITNKTKAIIAVHLAGYPCDMNSIMQLAKQHNLKVIEDCAQAHGARYHNQAVGTFGDVAAFSFCQDKIMTTGGEGGMLVTNNDEIYQRAWSYKDHGKDFDLIFNSDTSNKNNSKQSGFRWLHTQFGTNWRMTEMQAAIGRVQLTKLNSWVEQRRANANLLNTLLKDIPGLQIIEPPSTHYHAYYKYYVMLDLIQRPNNINKQEIITQMNATNIPCFSGVCPEIYLEKAFDNSVQHLQRLPNAKRISENAIMLLVHPTLNKQHMQYAAKILSKILKV